MRYRLLCCVAIWAVLVGPALGAEEDPAKTTKQQLAIAKAIQNSVAQVEYTLQFDKGDAPSSAGYRGSGAAEIIRQERPLEAPVLILSPTKVVAHDPILHERFIKDVSVRFGSQLIKARPIAYGLDQSAVILELAKPLQGAKPLVFDADKPGPYHGVYYHQRNGVWTVSVRSLMTIVAQDKADKRFLVASPGALIVSKDGTPVGMNLSGELPADESWKGSPLDWPTVTAEKLAKDRENLANTFRRGVMRVRLSFRSPRKTAEEMLRPSRGDEDDSTERNVLGGLIDDRRVLVLASLKPKVTARLQRIIVYPATGKPIEAKFSHTLKDYGAFVATLPDPRDGAVTVAPGEISDYRGKLLLAADVRLQGEKLTTYFWHDRIKSVRLGWKRNLYPVVSGDASRLMLFDLDGRIVAFPIARREKASVQRRWREAGPGLTAAAQLAEPLGDLAEHADAGNVPLTEAQENRLAWFGAALQPLSRELARINKVSHLTNDGSTGTLVSYVYPDSPAAKAELQVGDILIRLHVEGHPKPLDVSVDEWLFTQREFPWRIYNTMPEQVYDKLPHPWPPAENKFTRALTDLGFGKKFFAEIVRDGEVVRVPFEVTESPPHYNSAMRYKSKPLGITVRNMTYEVRRYFRKTPKDPGLIVSKVEPGSKGSVAGIKPYEIITHINDNPVMTVGDFENLIDQPGELRLSVKRMTKGRVVKVMLEESPPTTAPATTRPATTQPASGE